MKKLTIVLAVTLFASMAIHAQSDKEEMELIQSLFGMEKKAAIASFLQLEGEQANDFWNLYDAYETERKELGIRRMDLLNKYADQYLELDNEMTEKIIGESIALSKAYDKLVATYYKRIKKSSGAKVAAQFYQIEYYLKSYIRTIIFSEIPFVGEIE